MVVELLRRLRSLVSDALDPRRAELERIARDHALTWRASHDDWVELVRRWNLGGPIAAPVVKTGPVDAQAPGGVPASAAEPRPRANPACQRPRQRGVGRGYPAADPGDAA